MKNKAVEELREELSNLKKCHEDMWKTYGSELCSGDLSRKEKEIENKIDFLLREIKKKGINNMTTYERAEYYNSILKSDLFDSIDDFEYLNNKYAFAFLKDSTNAFVDIHGKYYTIEDLLEANESVKSMGELVKENDDLKKDIDKLVDFYKKHEGR